MNRTIIKATSPREFAYDIMNCMREHPDSILEKGGGFSEQDGVLLLSVALKYES